jgi:hypothetical protein
MKSLKSKSTKNEIFILNSSNNNPTQNVIVNNKITVNTTIKATAIYKPRTTQELKTKTEINQKLKDFSLTHSNSIKTGNKVSSSQNINIITYNSIISSTTKISIENNNNNKRDAETQTEDIFFRKYIY